MNIKVFKMLPPNLQREQALSLGVPIGRRQSGRYHIHLYSVYHFYAELYFLKENGRYASIRVFEETGKLKPYLEQIDITFLLPE